MHKNHTQQFGDKIANTHKVNLKQVQLSLGQVLGLLTVNEALSKRFVTE